MPDWSGIVEAQFPSETGMTLQYEEAKRLLPIIAAAAKSCQHLTYQMAAQKLGRPRNNARSVGASLRIVGCGRCPRRCTALALTTALTADLRVNPDAWAEVQAEIRNPIINRPQNHTFTNLALSSLKSFRTAFAALIAAEAA
jgi:hypothetical protein